MYTDIIPKISCQFLIGNVYQNTDHAYDNKPAQSCQFLIGNVYRFFRNLGY